ncbi:hypothetical protein DFH28DRAFT_902978 [Melampsora americana]|nr:hypothetical protein DFH28DRAFT_902978 [Melampsora americana]
MSSARTHPSDSDSSMSIDVNPPQTPNNLGRGASGLFQPPRPRNPPSATPNGSRHLSSLKKFADILKLSKESQDRVLKLYENTQPHEEYAATLSFLAYIGQEGLSGTGSKWVADKLIRDTFKKKVASLILDPTLQAFSATVDVDRTSLLQSLELLTFDFVKELEPDFVENHCPGDYEPGEACVPGSTLFLFIKEVLKNKRSKVRTTLLKNILGVSEGTGPPIPSAKTIVIEVARTFLPELQTLKDKALLNALGQAKVKWIVFMRYVTAYAQRYVTENKRRCQWTIMDEILAELRAKPEYTSHYFSEIFLYDRDVFNGTRSWADVKALPTLPQPGFAEVLLKIQEKLAAAQNNPAHHTGTEEDDYEAES